MMYDSSSTLRYYYYHRCLEYTLPAFTGINVLAQRGSEGDVLGEVYHQHSMEWNENGKWQFALQNFVQLYRETFILRSFIFTE